MVYTRLQERNTIGSYVIYMNIMDPWEQMYLSYRVERTFSQKRKPSLGQHFLCFCCVSCCSSLYLFFFFILRRMGQNKALAHHTSTYFHTRRVSI